MSCLCCVVFLALVIFALLKIFQKLTSGRCKSPAYLFGKTALITGGNSGIGYETALGLAARGCRVIIADKDNCDNSKASIIQKTGNNNIVTKYFDLSSLASIRKLAKDINETEDRLDILINNAGTTGLGNKYTSDGLHMGMQVNHFGPFLLTHLLIDLLKRSVPSRIVFVSSVMAYVGNFTLTKNNLNFFKDSPGSPLSEGIVYSNSKFCTTIASNILATKLKDTGVTSNCLHPGIVYTPIYTRFYNSRGAWPANVLTYVIYVLIKFCVLPFSKNAEEGAQTSLFLAMDDSVKNTSGKFFLDCVPVYMPQSAYANKIWRASEDYVKLLPNEKLI